ncbi:Potassium voltage-gated channel subfamily H member 7 [Cichlidogyrus casuarinus]|uniref:Potassium voltage-gated channel subfamily H member 7 n=1 Tax=Cichlidogyrus casuarinus TaxID=1844966 RepID=A0ABD2Q302_9PLAT
MLILLILNLITLPVGIAFFNEDPNQFWTCFNAISDTIFFLDIFVNFRTGIIKNDYADEIVLNPREIAIHYLRTWFILDLISSLPIDYIVNAVTTDRTDSELIPPL